MIKSNGRKRRGDKREKRRLQGELAQTMNADASRRVREGKTKEPTMNLTRREQARSEQRAAAVPRRKTIGEKRAELFGYSHIEAFCLMTYSNEEHGLFEVVYNSRDGVTPFVIFAPRDTQAEQATDAPQPAITGRDGSTIELQHTQWHLDEHAPNFVPPVGMRIFVDLTLEAATRYATDTAERAWAEDNEHAQKLREHYKTKEAAIAALVEDWTKEKGQPDLIVVTPEIHAAFERREIERRAYESIGMKRTNTGSVVRIDRQPLTFGEKRGLAAMNAATGDAETASDAPQPGDAQPGDTQAAPE